MGREQVIYVVGILGNRRSHRDHGGTNARLCHFPGVPQERGASSERRSEQGRRTIGSASCRRASPSCVSP